MNSLAPATDFTLKQPIELVYLKAYIGCREVVEIYKLVICLDREESGRTHRFINQFSRHKEPILQNYKNLGKLKGRTAL